MNAFRNALAAAICVALFPVVGQSQGTDSDLLEVVVVTAQKREQRELDVPITITTFSGGALEEIGIEEFDELSTYVPGLVVQEQSVNNPGFVI